MKVKAKFSTGKFGFYGSIRRFDGDEFDIDPKHFSKLWMVKIDEPKQSRTPKKEQVAITEDGGE